MDFIMLLNSFAFVHLAHTLFKAAHCNIEQYTFFAFFGTQMRDEVNGN